MKRRHNYKDDSKSNIENKILSGENHISAM